MMMSSKGLGFNALRHRHELFGLCEETRGMAGRVCPAEAAGGAGVRRPL